MTSLFKEYEKLRVLKENLVGKTLCWNGEEPTVSSFVVLGISGDAVTYQYLGGQGLISSRPLLYIQRNSYVLKQ
jgi:hypothetical protein